MNKIKYCYYQSQIATISFILSLAKGTNKIVPHYVRDYFYGRTRSCPLSESKICEH